MEEDQEEEHLAGTPEWMAPEVMIKVSAAAYRSACTPWHSKPSDMSIT